MNMMYSKASVAMARLRLAQLGFLGKPQKMAQKPSRCCGSGTAMAGLAQHQLEPTEPHT
jgi:hypothetical protein